MLTKPLQINRGQALSIWSLMSELPPETQLFICEVRDDGEIWCSAKSSFGGERYYKLPAGGGHELVAEDAMAVSERESLRKGYDSTGALPE